MSPIEHIIRPIVMGQLIGFIKEHPSLLDCVNWFRPNLNKEEVFANSAGKRIILDLISDQTVARLREALLGTPTEQCEGVAHHSALSKGSSGGTTTPAASPSNAKDENDALLEAEKLLKDNGYVVAFTHKQSAPEKGGVYYGRPMPMGRIATGLPVLPRIVTNDLFVNDMNGYLPVSAFEWFGPVPLPEIDERHY